MNNKNWVLEKLPINIDFETKKVLKSLPIAHAALAELKGIATTIPNQSILINTLVLQEAKDSSAIENIITTHDELYKSDLEFYKKFSLDTKEVQRYARALKKGVELIKENNLLTNKVIIEVQSELEKNNAGFRKLPGTTLKNSSTNEIIYTPPQNLEEIIDLMDNLEEFINNDELTDLDVLIKLAIIHYQFESIHPFYDGNGRTGRILNILYLIIKGLQDLPILYLSNYIIKNKSEYYRLLQEVRDKNNWEEWLLYLIKGVEITSKETTEIIKEMKHLMLEIKNKLRDNYKFYSQDLLNNLFKHPYTKIEFVMNDLNISRITAANYLNELAKDGILKKEKFGNSNYYINIALYELLRNR